MSKHSFKVPQFVKSFFSFRKGERRGIIYFLPLLAVVAILINAFNKPHFEQGFIEAVDSRLEAEKNREHIKRDSVPMRSDKRTGVKTGTGSKSVAREERKTAEQTERFKRSQTESETSNESGTQSQPSPVKKKLVDINIADSATLRSVYGIGEILVVRIMDYRERLGGFCSVGQLVEIKGMTSENFERIKPQILVDSCGIKKIDINFATHKEIVERLGDHPYMTDAILRKMLKQRQLKGGWSTPGDMVNDEIMTNKEAERLAPYLIFRQE